MAELDPYAEIRELLEKQREHFEEARDTDDYAAGSCDANGFALETLRVSASLRAKRQQLQRLSECVQDLIAALENTLLHTGTPMPEHDLRQRSRLVARAKKLHGEFLEHFHGG